MSDTFIDAQGSSQKWAFFFDLPTEIQLLVMSKLSLLELQNTKLINHRFNRLANVDQLWRRHALQTAIEDSIMREAREVCGSGAVDNNINANHEYSSSSSSTSPPPPPPIFSWQALLRTATLIERENRRLIQGNLSQMTQKIHQVREALDRQTRVLEETHQKLELLSGRLTLMEQQSRVRELEKSRARRREEARLEDEKWLQEWDELCASYRLKDASPLPSSMHCHENQGPEERKVKASEFGGSMTEYDMNFCVDENEDDDDDDEDDDDRLFTINSSFKGSCTITRVDSDGASSSSSSRSSTIESRLEETQLPVIEVTSNGKERAERRSYPGL